ncbi:MAG: hypothetical protein AAGC95_06835 [Pseudomonadota bacterium]
MHGGGFYSFAAMRSYYSAQSRTNETTHDEVLRTSDVTPYGIEMQASPEPFAALSPRVKPRRSHPAFSVAVLEKMRTIQQAALQ